MIERQLKSCLLALCSLFLLTGAALAQRQISGTVTDLESGEPLIGVSVSVPGTTTGTITDVNGTYRLTIPADATSLKVIYTGYTEQTVTLGAGNTVDVALSSGIALNETLIIGYGTIKREDATGSVQSVSSANFNKGAITSTQELFAGKIAGVVVTSDDGAPGAGSKIRIRGESSLSASNAPLVVVDGIPLDNGGVNGARNQLNFINPNDIESVTVLKDASAAAIYGNRASGGVILITTKKGKLGKGIQVGYNASVSVGQIYNKIDVLSADEFRSAINNHYAGNTATRDKALALLGTSNTDWQDEIYQSAWGTDHNVNLSGGVGPVPYRVSLGYTNKDGVLKTDNFNRYSGAINLNPGFLNNTLQVNASFKGSISENHFADRGAIGAALSYDPTQAVRDTSSRFGGFTYWKTSANNSNPNTLAPANPISLLELKDDNSKIKQYIANVSVDYRFPFLPALRANLNLGYDYSKGNGTVVIPNYAAFAFSTNNGNGISNVYENTRNNSVLEAYLNYKNTFGDHDIDVMGGYSWQHFENASSAKNDDLLGTNAAKPALIDKGELYMLSLFGRVNYAYKNRFLLTGSLRRDGTSRFAPEYRWGLFPAAAAAVKVIENDRQYLNNLKVRASWGLTGQQDIGSNNYYAYLPLYQYSDPFSEYQLGDRFYQTVRPNGYVYNIKWEETSSFNAGVDFSIVKGRISGTLDFYQRTSTDLLNYTSVPALSNLTNLVYANIGNMESKGIELGLNFTPVRTKNVTWDLAANVAYNKSEITKLRSAPDPSFLGDLTGSIAGGVGSNIQINSVGYNPAMFFVYKQLYDENGNLLEGQFENNDIDTALNNFDKYRYKTPAPFYTLGITSNLQVGHFSFSFAGRANLGNYVYNNVQTDMGYLDRLFSTNYVSNVHQSAVDLNVSRQSSLTFSDHFITNASFFRLDHVTVSYSFDHLLGDYLNIYATVQNALVITKYKGLDPEIGNGIDNQLYPRPRTFVLGLNVNF